ncbi:MAG: RHS repeat protein, partial [Chloroflexi bacterium]|nr:RHS repeat protein [Chloroflexota bacterium]
DYTADGVNGFNIVTTYEYDADNQLTHQEQAAAGLVSFTDFVADINGNPAQQQDELGYGATSLYDDADRLVNRIDAAGQTITYTHDVNGRVENVISPDGAINRAEYDGFNRVERSISNWVDGVYDPNHPGEDIAAGYQYDNRNNTIVVTDTLGRMNRTFYDDLNRVTGGIANWTPGTTLADCAALPLLRDHDICSQTAYDEVGRTIIVTDTLGRMNRTFYDEMGRVSASVTNWNPATLAAPADCILSPTNASEENICTLYGYDDAGRQITTTNALDQTSLTVYDVAGRPIVNVANWDGVTTITDDDDCHFPPLQPDVNVCSVTVYDALSRRIQTQDAMSHVTDFDYDGLGRVVTTTRYLANGDPVINVSHYDARGQNYAQTNAEGHTTHTVFDELGRVVSSISAAGIASSQTYDDNGRVIATTNALGHAATSDYDNLGRLITTTNPLGQATIYQYDSLGNQTGMVDAEGVATHYEYDNLNRRVAVIENWDGVAACQLVAGSPDANVCTQTTFDALGNQVSVVNARGYTNTHTVYDSLNRAIVVEDALGNQTHTQYNALGYRTVVTDANDAVTRYFYDDLNRLVQISYEADGETVEYAYDTLGNRTLMTDSLGVTVYEYDDLSRLITVTSPLTGTLIYGYDLVGNRTSLTYPDGKVVTYTYNADNQMEQVFDWDGGVTTYTYDAAGRLETTTLPNGVQTTNSYDDASRIIGLRHEDTNTGLLQAEYLYELDGTGNRCVVTETMQLPDGTVPEQQLIVYDYDPLYRMTEAVYTGILSGTYTYQHDAVGNRIYHTNNVTTTEIISYTYDAANRLLESVDLTTSEVTAYDWDDAGRLITTTVAGNVAKLYQYSQDGDLLQAEVDGLVTTFAYDGNGQRLQLSIAGEATTFMPDYSGRSNRVLFEQGLEETKQYLYGAACLGEYVTDNVTSETEWRYYQRDGRTLVRQTTNQT